MTRELPPPAAGFAVVVNDDILLELCAKARRERALLRVQDLLEARTRELRQLETQNRQLQKSESLGRMAGAIAHHFNNQLMTLMANLELASDTLPRDGSERALECLTEALRAAGRGAEVSGLMLTYLGQTPAQREPLDLSEACQESLSLLRAGMPSRVILETDLPSPGPAISANANQIQQVLANLVTNAWEALPDGQGRVEVAVKTVSPAEIAATCRFPIDWRPRSQAYARLEVADSGRGMAEQEVENIFDPFFSRKLAGRRLGLSVALGIVRAQDGAITVASSPGRGSRFQVFFPVLAEAVPQPPTRPAPAPPLLGGGTMLLVEDEPSLRKVLASSLARLGFTLVA